MPNPILARLFRSLGLFALILAVTLPAYAAEAPGRTSPQPSRALAPVLLLDCGDTQEADDWYHAFMNSMFGQGNWDYYDLQNQGLPDPPELFLGVLRQYSCVLVHAGDDGSAPLANALGVLSDFIDPLLAEAAPGNLVLVAPYLSRVFLAASGSDRTRFAEALGISPLMTPALM